MFQVRRKCLTKTHGNLSKLLSDRQDHYITIRQSISVTQVLQKSHSIYFCVAKCRAVSSQTVTLFGKMALWKKIKYLDIFLEQNPSYVNFALKSQMWYPNGVPRQRIWTRLSGMHRMGLSGCLCRAGSGTGWSWWAPSSSGYSVLEDKEKWTLKFWEVNFTSHKNIPKHMLFWEGFTLPGIHKMVLRTSKCFSVKGQDLQYNTSQTQKHYEGLFHSITFQHEKEAYNLGGVLIFYPKNYCTQAAIHCFND